MSDDELLEFVVLLRKYAKEHAGVNTSAYVRGLEMAATNILKRRYADDEAWRENIQ